MRVRIIDEHGKPQFFPEMNQHSAFIRFSYELEQHDEQGFVITSIQICYGEIMAIMHDGNQEPRYDRVISLLEY